MTSIILQKVQLILKEMSHFVVIYFVQIYQFLMANKGLHVVLSFVSPQSDDLCQDAITSEH